MGTSKKEASGYGTAAGTAIGSIWGPAGAAVGGTLGGAVGGMLGSDPKPPSPVDLPPPQMPGGVSGTYGGWTIDPVTGRTVFYDNQANGGMTAEQYRNLQLKDQMLGGNSAGVDLQSQITQIQNLIQRLSGQGPNAPAGPQATDFLAKEWVNPDGTPKKPGVMDASKEMRERSDLFKVFEGQAAGRGYGKGSTLEQFTRWISDAYRNNIQAQVSEFENAKKTSTGNQQTSGEALQAAQTKLQSLMSLQGGQAPGDNPIMNYLNQRNTSPNAPDYRSMFDDPNVEKMQGETDYYQGKSRENIDFDALRAQLGLGADPGIPDAKAFNAQMLSQYGGALGGERMNQIGDYDSSKLGSWLAAQDRIAGNASASNLRSAEAAAAKRGLLGSSINDSSRLDAQMALQDQLVGNAAKTYSMDAQDRNNWFNQRFAVDQHNSDVARTAAQGKLSLNQSGFGNELAAKQLYEQIMGNRQGMNTSEQQRAFNNMMASLGQRTALDQREIDNGRYEQGLDRQNFADRMGFLGYLSGSQGQGLQAELGRAGVQQGQNQLGAQVGLTTTGWGNDYNIANAAQQNAYNMGQFNTGQAGQAQQSNNWNTLAGALGQYGGQLWGSQPSTTPATTAPDMGNLPTGNNPPVSYTPPQTPNNYPSMFAGPTYSTVKPPSNVDYWMPK